MIGLLAVVAILIGCTATLLWARSHALGRRPNRTLDAATPLSPGERLRLRHRERRLRRVFVLVGFAYLVLVGMSLSGLEPGPFDAALGLTLLGVALLLGALVQFSESCPRCGFNLGFQSRQLRSESCDRCGGSCR